MSYRRCRAALRECCVRDLSISLGTVSSFSRESATVVEAASICLRKDRSVCGGVRDIIVLFEAIITLRQRHSVRKELLCLTQCYGVEGSVVFEAVLLSLMKFCV